MAELYRGFHLDDHVVDYLPANIRILKFKPPNRTGSLRPPTAISELKKLECVHLESNTISYTPEFRKSDIISGELYPNVNKALEKYFLRF